MRYGEIGKRGVMSKVRKHKNPEISHLAGSNPAAATKPVWNTIQHTVIGSVTR